MWGLWNRLVPRDEKKNLHDQSGNRISVENMRGLWNRLVP